MIVCHCHVITDKEIRNNIKNGATSVEDIGCACKACTACGGCKKTVLEILEEETNTSAK